MRPDLLTLHVVAGGKMVPVDVWADVAFISGAAP